MQVLGVEFEFDFCDADQVEVYEREARRVVKRIKDERNYEGKSNADGMRIQCRIIDDFFDTVFGEGAADKLFHGKANLRVHMEAFGEVSLAVKEDNTKFRELVDRYVPNRAVRQQDQVAKQEFNRFQGNAVSHKKKGAKHNKGRNRSN